MAVYKDKDRGTYYFIIRVKQLDGKVKQIKKRGFPTKKAAKIAEAEAMIATPSHSGIPFNQLAEEYMDWYSSRRKQTSVIKINGIINNHLIPEFGDLKLSDIRPKRIIDFHSKLIKKKFSANHIQTIHSTLSTLFNYAIKSERMTENPARLAGNVDMKVKKNMNYWLLDEFKQFISYVDDSTLYTLFMVLYYSGMRKGELLALTWSDVDFETNLISVNKTSNNRIVSTPKTDSSIRKILMPNHVMDLLRQLKKEVNPKPSYVVFGEYHSSITASTLVYKFEKYIALSGVKKIKIHDFRHSHASYLINKKTIIGVVASRLGHSNPSTTLNIYSHMYPSTEQEAVLSMEDDFKTAKILKLLT